MEISSLNEQQVTMQLQISPGLPPSRFYAIIVPSRFSFFQGHSRYSIHSLLELDRARPNCAHLDGITVIRVLYLQSGWQPLAVFVFARQYTLFQFSISPARMRASVDFSHPLPYKRNSG